MKKKRLLSLMLAVLMLFSVIGTLPAKASSTKTQTVGVTGMGTYTGGFTDTSWNVWVSVSPDVTTVDNWAWPGDEWSVPVVVSGAPYTAIVHYQSPSMLNFWFATNLGTPATGTEFTIKAVRAPDRALGTESCKVQYLFSFKEMKRSCCNAIQTYFYNCDRFSGNWGNG